MAYGAVMQTQAVGRWSLIYSNLSPSAVRPAEKSTVLYLTAVAARRMEAANNCQIDILLLYETVLDDVMKVMFPINTLRNYALLQAKTPLVSMVDVDLIVSNALLQWLLEQKK
eukprot:GHUV01037827.1.p1 GENE.GHUV01037827.1~~GHUV01037827.1.p1  ORF type:complete len:113 (-),score=29.95 GHUV01037827.1:339-677(-)